MLFGEELMSAFAALSPNSLAGTGYRVINLRYADSPLSGAGALKHGGRFNYGAIYHPGQEFEALYVAEGLMTALTEADIVVRGATGYDEGVPSIPKVIFSIEYRLSAVIDLTEDSVRDSLTLTPNELETHWLRLNGEGKAAPTQVLGYIAYQQGNISGLRYPSFKDPDFCNLVIFDRHVPGDYLWIFQRPESNNPGLAP
ncbi:RES family NAD+ phosphorylase [Candidatus Cyanaurora vandensis]|uniref:RES family NAD+ phosphorylase n=1 Tax=Candidatus Cyanaurora vandensis TaxID=2714958 RepID=UPI00257AB639|nr:RES family NAD+ phosphorylase [Candidatus Cyanaurora vandensis]